MTQAREQFMIPHRVRVRGHRHLRLYGAVELSQTVHPFMHELHVAPLMFGPGLDFVEDIAHDRVPDWPYLQWRQKQRVIGGDVGIAYLLKLEKKSIHLFSFPSHAPGSDRAIS